VRKAGGLIETKNRARLHLSWPWWSAFSIWQKSWTFRYKVIRGHRWLISSSPKQLR